MLNTYIQHSLGSFCWHLSSHSHIHRIKASLQVSTASCLWQIIIWKQYFKASQSIALVETTIFNSRWSDQTWWRLASVLWNAGCVSSFLEQMEARAGACSILILLRSGICASIKVGRLWPPDLGLGEIWIPYEVQTSDPKFTPSPGTCRNQVWKTCQLAF